MIKDNKKYSWKTDMHTHQWAGKRMDGWEGGWAGTWWVGGWVGRHVVGGWANITRATQSQRGDITPE